MDLLELLASGEMGRKPVEVPEFATPDMPGLFEARELSVEDRILVRDASWVATGETDNNGNPLRKWSEARNNLAWVAYCTFRPGGDRVFTVPGSIDKLLLLPGRYGNALNKLLAAALEVNLATAQAEGSAPKNSSKKTRKSATS